MRTLLLLAGLLLSAARADGATLVWAASQPGGPDPTDVVAGYVVHVGTQPRVYTTSVDVGNVQAWTLPTLSPGQTYYFAVSAYDSRPTRVFSDISDEVSYAEAPQPAPCVYTLSGPTTPLGSGGATGAIQIAASQSTCAWSAASNVGWVTVGPPSTGTGSASLSFVMAANPTTSQRQAVITVGQSTFTLTQAPMPPSNCTSTTRPVVTPDTDKGSYRHYSSTLTLGQTGYIHLRVRSQVARRITSVYVDWGSTRVGELSGVDLAWIAGILYRPATTGSQYIRVTAIDELGCSGSTSATRLVTVR